MLGLSRSYLENDGLSYRQAVRSGRTLIGYRAALSSPSTIDERVLHHMTLWRMLAWLGTQLAALAAGRRLILQSNPHSTCHRFVGAVSPEKFRSPQRQQHLQQSRQLLHVMAEWEGLFGKKFFPRFATRSGFS